jgi:hypothetical protein
VQIEAVGREPARYHLLLVAIDTPAVLAKRFSVAVNRAAPSPTHVVVPHPVSSARASPIPKGTDVGCCVQYAVQWYCFAPVLCASPTTTFRVVVPSLSREVVGANPEVQNEVDLTTELFFGT